MTDAAKGGGGFGAAPIAAGFVAVLVGFASSAAIVYQAAIASGASTEQFGSWMGALGLGMAVTSAGLSWRYRAPVLTAWSTPGAALVAGTAAVQSLPHAIGAFVVCGALILLTGLSGWFERAMSRVPLALASALLAGVLVRFAIEVVPSLRSQPVLVGAMIAAYLLGRRQWPRYAVIGVLLAGGCVAAALGVLRVDGISLALARPHFEVPECSLQSVLGLGIPLFVVTMASQNVPGVATLRAFGYGRVPVSPVIAATGLATVLLAPFGGFAFNLAAITAAICMGREAHEDPARRWLAAAAAGGFYLLLGLFGGTVASLFGAFPRELVVSIAGLALLGTIANSLATAVQEASEREAALVTFVVTAAGIEFLGIGAAFWGLVAGLGLRAALSWRP